MKVLIIEAGFGGIAAAVELARNGITDVTILEKAPDFGGTWFHNSYPGAACDVPSHLYSFSYAQRRDWSRLCSTQREILDYVHQVAHDLGVDRLIVTGRAVTACHWDDTACRWQVTTGRGDVHEADAIVIATGQLHKPSVPHIEGAGTFAGHTFHSAEWDHGYDLTGKRVAVVGNGASAVQFVPEIAGQLQKLAIRHPRTVGRLLHLRSALFMRWQLRDRELRRKVWPDYTFGCKRVLFSSYFLPALARPNVELVTDPIRRMTTAGIVTADERLREVDCVIWGTGFKATEFMFPMQITGVAGLDMRDAWAGGAHAHLGMTVPGFPSMFVMYGPNTNTSGGSIIFYQQAQASYIRQALQLIQSRGGSAIEVRPEVEAASDREVQSRFAGTAWTRCDSWYRDASGRIVANWPGYMREYMQRTRELDPAEYRPVEQPPRVNA